MIERTHIGIFGKRNAGKSSVINMLTNQEVSIVSPLPGTTTDPVTKPIEINGIGACVFIDTAGYDDAGEIGAMRVTKTKQVLQRCDISLFVIPTTIIDNIEELREDLRRILEYIDIWIYDLYKDDIDIKKYYNNLKEQIISILNK